MSTGGTPGGASTAVTQQVCQFRDDATGHVSIMIRNNESTIDMPASSVLSPACNVPTSLDLQAPTSAITFLRDGKLTE